MKMTNKLIDFINKDAILCFVDQSVIIEIKNMKTRRQGVNGKISEVGEDYICFDTYEKRLMIPLSLVVVEWAMDN